MREMCLEGHLTVGDPFHTVSERMFPQPPRVDKKVAALVCGVIALDL